MSVSIAIDAGHGYTKALSASTQTIFPSLICPAPAAVDLGRFGPSDSVAVETDQYPRIRYLVGDAARLRAVSLFSHDKASDPTTLALTWIAASRLVGPGYHAITLGVGVPLAWYAEQQGTLARILTQTVRLENGHGTTLAVLNTTVFPQGVGALAAQADLPKKALVGLVDIGYRTVDFLLAETDAYGLPRPIPDRSGTYAGGMHQAYLNLAQTIERETGTHWEPHELVDRDTISAHGRATSLVEPRRRAIADLSRAIQTHLATQWDGLIDRLDALYLAGGGAVALQSAHPWDGAQGLDDPQWANARGFLGFLA